MANRFLGAKISKKFKFMGLDIEICKLTVKQVIEIQEESKKLSGSEDEYNNLKLLISVIKMGAEELVELTDEELNNFPIDELTKLSNEIMSYSGLAPSKDK